MAADLAFASEQLNGGQEVDPVGVTRKVGPSDDADVLGVVQSRDGLGGVRVTPDSGGISRGVWLALGTGVVVVPWLGLGALRARRRHGA